MFLWGLLGGGAETFRHSVASDSVQGAPLTGSTVPPASTMVGAWGSGTLEGRVFCSVGPTSIYHWYPPWVPPLTLTLHPPSPLPLPCFSCCCPSSLWFSPPLSLSLPLHPPPLPLFPSPPSPPSPRPHRLSFPPPFPSRDTTMVVHTKRRLLIQPQLKPRDHGGGLISMNNQLGPLQAAT